MADELEWAAPGPGSWTRDPTHFNQPMTMLSLSLGAAGGPAMATGFARAGITSAGSDAALINGWPYQRVRPLDPTTFAEREATARDFLDRRRWTEWLATWEREGRPAMTAACSGLIAVDPASLDDDALVRHLDDAATVAMEGSRWHFEQHALCVLIGLLLRATRSWGIPDADVVALLDGASPASAATANALDAIAAELSARGVRPRSLDDVRSAAPELLDAYLAEHGWRPIGAFDLDVRVLAELPEAVLASVVAALDGRTDKRPTPPVDAVRERVPPGERERFDQLLADARSVYGLRDEDVALSMSARGCIRRAALEVAGRLVARGLLEQVDDVFVLAKGEAAALLTTGDGPDRSEVAARVAHRKRCMAADAPLVLGDAPAPADFSALPPTTRLLTEAMALYTSVRQAPREKRRLAGSGIGREAYRGRAVVAARADDALHRVEPGDVLVTTMTTPAFNGILPVCGALVVEDAGLLSHAAVMARELGLPAIVGLGNATTDIPDGADIEVDPVAGEVRLVTPARTDASR